MDIVFKVFNKKDLKEKKCESKSPLLAITIQSSPGNPKGWNNSFLVLGSQHGVGKEQSI
jgi:hypothetical protein